MTSRTLASWVAPVAAKERDTAAEIVALARSLPAAAWGRPSPLEGWTYKDVLAHLASNDDLRYLLQGVIAKERVDPARFVRGGADALNAREVAARRDRTVEQVIAEFEALEEEVQELLARLTDADQAYQQEDIPWNLAQAFGYALNEPGFHYKQHLEQLRTALNE